MHGCRAYDHQPSMASGLSICLVYPSILEYEIMQVIAPSYDKHCLAHIHLTSFV
uniref:Uncharacterized protein n=1 Tax=Arion vulgaris TaxID=1028688 RepID=A0A0B7B668_9EUPU